MGTPHRHHELELNLALAGRATYLLRDRRYELTAGTLVWLFPAQDHVLLERSDDFAYWLGVFRSDFVALLVQGTGAARLAEPGPDEEFCRRLDRTVAAQLGSLYHHVAEAGPLARGAALGHALLRSWECFREARDGPALVLHPAVAHVAALLRSDHPPATLADLARKVGLTPPYLSELFRREMGIGLAEFRNRVRLERYERLAPASRTLLEAALEAGFGSYAQFYKVYVRAFGRAPSAVR